MIEPSARGFTGVVWEARPARQLAHDLSTGAGSGPAAEAGIAWTRLATSFTAAALEYGQIIASLRAAWQSATSDIVHERISPLQGWLDDTATAAATNADNAETHAASYELARLTMPNTDEIAAIETTQQSAALLGAALGAPLLGVGAQADADADLAKATAARTMRTYEMATQPLAPAANPTGTAPAVPPAVAPATYSEHSRAGLPAVEHGPSHERAPFDVEITSAPAVLGGAELNHEFVMRKG